MQNEDPNAFGGPNMTIEDKIRLLAELSGDERREVEEHVETHGDEHPHLKELLRQSKQLERLLASARLLDEDPPGEEALALYAVMRSVDASRLPTDLAEAFERIEGRLQHDPQLRRQLQEFETRAERLEQESDAERQFARLLGELHPTENGRPPRAADRGPSTSKRNLRRAVGAALAMAVIYATLFLVGRFAQPPHERIAQFESAELVLEGYDQVRGDGPAPVTNTTATYLRALTLLREAETSFIGLFPRYDVPRLDSAAVLLQRVIAEEPEDSFLASEAHYILGKTELARGNLDDAGRHLAIVRGMRRDEARLVLEEIENLR